MSSIGAPELLIVLVIVLLLFGATRLPKLARSLGEAKNEFERTSIGTSSDDETVTLSKAEVDRLKAAAAQPVAQPTVQRHEETVTLTQAELTALKAQASAVPASEDKVTLTKAELEALLKKQS